MVVLWVLVVAAIALAVNTSLSLTQTLWSYRGYPTKDVKKFLNISVVLITISYILTFLVIFQSLNG